MDVGRRPSRSKQDVNRLEFVNHKSIRNSNRPWADDVKGSMVEFENPRSTNFGIRGYLCILYICRYDCTYISRLSWTSVDNQAVSRTIGTRLQCCDVQVWIKVLTLSRWHCQRSPPYQLVRS